MIAQTYVRFPSPVTLSLRIAASRARVLPGGTSSPRDPVRREFSALPLHLQIDAQRRVIAAYLPPVPQSLRLYSEGDFLDACGDTMEDHASRVLQLLGADPASVLQSLIDGGYSDNLAACPRPVRRFSKLKLRRVLREVGMESLLDGFLASDPVALADWNDSQVLMFDDPMLTQAIPSFAATTGMTEEKIISLLQSCKD